MLGNQETELFEPRWSLSTTFETWNLKPETLDYSTVTDFAKLRG